MMTTTEVAELLHVTPAQVRRLAAAGHLHPVGTELRNSPGRPTLLFHDTEAIEYEAAHRKDQHVTTLAKHWRDSA